MPTQFTVHWKVANYATDVQGVELSAFLKPGVTWTGNTQSNSGSAPTYNPRTQEVSWRIDRIPATKGVVSDPFEAIFQIEALPNLTMIGRALSLVGETRLKSFDEFTGAELFHVAPALTTQSLPNTVPQQWIVVQ
jgi:hypothetical protein